MGLALEALRATGAKLRKNFQYVFIEIMFLYVSVRKINFTQMGKYGKHCEQTYRNNFTKQVDWLAYNTFLTGKVFDKPGDLIAIAVDQSHITKYGKCTWGMGKFWSGGRMQLLEELGLDGGKKDLHDWYIKVIKDYAEQLKAITNILVADALYSTEKIVAAMVILGFVMVSRLRKDTVLRYLHTGPRTGKRGAPRKYDGRIDPENPDLGKMERVEGLCCEGEGEYYTLVANVKCLKRNVRLVIWYPNGVAGIKEKGGGYKLFFSTSTEMSAEDIVAVYKARFQLEFVFRDGNQFTGLEDCQARSREKLDFAFNASLASINTAKAAIKEMGADLSVGEYTALMHSILLYHRIICVSGFKPDPAINRKVMDELVMLAKNAA